jgi:hypothetical protein
MAMAVALAVAAACAGCPDPPCEAPDPACGAAVAWLGSICADTNTDPSCVDDEAFAPLHLEGAVTPGGVDLVVHMGPQGGFHTFLSVRTWQLDPGDPSTPKGDAGNPTVTWTVKDGDTLLGTRTLRVGLLDNGDGSYERAGVAVVLDQDLVISPQNIDGRTLTIELTVTDVDGVTVTDTATVRAVGIIG